MQNELESYLLQIPELESRAPAELIDYFLYFMTVIYGKESAQPADVEACFNLTKINKYSNISAYLARHSKPVKGSKPKFIKNKFGYHLERNSQLGIQKTLHTGPARIETSHLLRALLSKLSKTEEKSFLQEAIDCYEIGARRASIVMVWILTMHHLYEYTLTNHLTSFNNVLSKNTDKRIKIIKVTNIDDFTEIPENKFIEFLRSAKIITNDIRKILDTKLGIRNSSAHPSSVTISEVKATDFVIDLAENVINKYKI